MCVRERERGGGKIDREKRNIYKKTHIPSKPKPPPPTNHPDNDSPPPPRHPSPDPRPPPSYSPPSQTRPSTPSATPHEHMILCSRRRYRPLHRHREYDRSSRGSQGMGSRRVQCRHGWTCIRWIWRGRRLYLAFLLFRFLSF